jgi:hypothetical protein
MGEPIGDGARSRIPSRTKRTVTVRVRVLRKEGPPTEIDGHYLSDKWAVAARLARTGGLACNHGLPSAGPTKEGGSECAFSSLG